MPTKIAHDAAERPEQEAFAATMLRAELEFDAAVRQAWRVYRAGEQSLRTAREAAVRAARGAYTATARAAGKDR